MDKLTARPQILKQVNLSLIRKIIKSKRTVTRAEIAKEAKISSTTVRTLLSELLKSGEIESVGYDESSGGRKAERYCLIPNKYYGVAFCMAENKIHALLVNPCEEIVEITQLEFIEENYVQAIIEFLDEITMEKEIKSIGLGLPGIVEGGGYWKKPDCNGELYKVDIGDTLTERYKIPVILENDMNATAIGFGRCYANQFPQENPEDSNMVYLHLKKGCIGAGFIAGGRIIRGYNHFAGEIGLIPADGDKLLDDVMSQPMDDVQYIKWVIHIIGWICGILNPQYIALAGSELPKDFISQISDGLLALLPKSMLAEILYAPDIWHDYHDGMAHLTAGKMFDEVQFISL